MQWKSGFLGVMMLLVCLMAATPSGGSTYQLPAAADADVWLDSPTTNYGTNPTLAVRNFTGYGNRYPYLKFLLSAIPSGEVITGATLHLAAYQVVNNNPTALSLYHVSDDNWIESGITGITWNQKPDYDPVALADVTMAKAETWWPSDVWVIWDLNEYDNWTPDTEGAAVSLLLMCPDPISVDFVGKDSTGSIYRPYLEVTTSPVPLPGAAWLLGSGLLGLAGWRRLRKG